MKITRDGKFQIVYVDDTGIESSFRCSSAFSAWVMAHVGCGGAGGDERVAQSHYVAMRNFGCGRDA